MPIEGRGGMSTWVVMADCLTVRGGGVGAWGRDEPRGGGQVFKILGSDP